MSVHSYGSFGGGAGVVYGIPFTARSATEPLLTIDAPPNGTPQGDPLTISGTYSNFAPDALIYAIDGLTPGYAPSPTIDGGVWQFTIPAPFLIEH